MYNLFCKNRKGAKTRIDSFQIERILAQHDPFHQIYIKDPKNDKFLALYVCIYVYFIQQNPTILSNISKQRCKEQLKHNMRVMSKTV